MVPMMLGWGMGIVDFLLDLIYTSHVCLHVVVSFTAGTGYVHISPIISFFIFFLHETIGHDFPQGADMNSSEPAKSESLSLSLFCSTFFVDI